MTLRRLLEEFEASTRPTSDEFRPELAPEDIEGIRAKAYEAGYASGWDDASKAAEDQRAKVDAEFVRCVQDLGFTFHEAVGHVQGGLAELLSTLLDQFFPAILPDLLRETVREEILKNAEPHLEPTIVLVASSDTAPHFEGMVSNLDGISLELIEEPTLGPNQAFLKFQDREILADFGPLIEATRNQLLALADKDTREAEHG